MRRSAVLAAGIALGVMGAMPAQAEGVNLYPYATNVNYCPAGLQPIVLAGVICCGRPTTGISYQQVMRHPVRKKRHYTARVHCPAGTKGCS